MNIWWLVSWAIGMGFIAFGFWLLRDDPHPATGWPSGSAGFWFLISLVVGTGLVVISVRSTVQALTAESFGPALGTVALASLGAYSLGRRWLTVGTCLLVTAVGTFAVFL